MDRRLLAAIANNARWCDGVARANGVPTAVSSRCWVARARSPQFYPDLITLAPDANVEDAFRYVDTGPGCSVKDSFAVLDLGSRGFARLFEARWNYLAAHRPRRSARWAWSVVRTESELTEWKRAHGEAAAFTPGLLRNDSLRLLLARNSSGVAGGAALNRSGAAVGVSNLFVTDSTDDGVWADLTSAAADQFPGLALVGYEGGDSLVAALASGFVDLGPLQVWLLPDAAGSTPQGTAQSDTVRSEPNDLQ